MCIFMRAFVCFAACTWDHIFAYVLLTDVSLVVQYQCSRLPGKARLQSDVAVTVQHLVVNRQP